MNYIQILISHRFLSNVLLFTSSLLNQFLVQFRMILIILLVSGLIGCNQITETAIKLNLNVSWIGKIQRKGKIDNQVYLKGVVEGRAPFLETGAYELTDSTGSIWILTRAELPKIGAKITIKGKIRYQSIVVPQLGNKDVGDFYIEELERIEEENYE
ncbi:MAG: DNA-binding protein [Trichodesmium sp. St16_bin4-tuft]|nr:DNA-binding protein [Trichodesmium sp. MAG_R01]MDE5069278.1 DNA-binding protein [Trichodesmium sp. St4_bin8_1]MDE5071120.1 DNA-binding protein [Trichodesmium sp. St5_bin8]MDE5079193.1 DNA-binding protein [Trichodesmium sp. St2_bin6]MDE5091246.1 DNA-binding protein [Trichodesmium sp. St18_bin3_1_1]MDE5097316.1 DNA-binding protein [Trichodesmium sp. St16_bin4-tuft]MDE5104174.1 DNA-binding protein [Trichodesmium sp. St19_bin2]